MRTLLRSATTNEFMAADGTWTRDITQARVFRDTSSVREAAGRETGKVLEIYYSFSEQQVTQWDFGLRLDYPAGRMIPPRRSEEL